MPVRLSRSPKPQHILCFTEPTAFLTTSIHCIHTKYSTVTPLIQTMYQLNLLLAAVLSTAVLTSAAIPPSPISTPILPVQTTQDNNTAPQLPYGVVIDHCTVPNTIAIAFDDGPYIYTDQILDIFANTSIHATFFLNGDWKGNIDNLSHVVKRTLAEGHQIGSHSYVPRLPPLSYPIPQPTLQAPRQLTKHACIYLSTTDGATTT